LLRIYNVLFSTFTFYLTKMLETTYSASLKPLNTFGFDVKARCLMRAHSEAEVLQALGSGEAKGAPLLVLGGGSNLLFTKDYEGVVLQPLMQHMEVAESHADSVLLRVGAGVVWDDLVAHAVASGWYGLENLSHIPGRVGASPVQNIGAYGVEAKDAIEQVQYIDLESLEVRQLTNAQCRFGYRSSIFKQELRGRAVITQVCFRLRRQGELRLAYGDLHQTVAGMGGATLRNVRRAVTRIRRSKLPDPAELGSAGSFFKNPLVANTLFESLRQRYPAMPGYPAEGGMKIPAGWLIEQSGLKGVRRGSVGVHPRQALVLVNYGGGTGGEVLALAKEVAGAVRSSFGVALEMEVNVI
jgi:UDP-N-acetylmuramate dehydrogenase